jgi:hypothetical protein
LAGTEQVVESGPADPDEGEHVPLKVDHPVKVTPVGGESLNAAPGSADPLL